MKSTCLIAKGPSAVHTDNFISESPEVKKEVEKYGFNFILMD
jgi:hypothetical protein